MESKAVEHHNITIRLQKKAFLLKPWAILLVLFCANTVFRSILANFPKCISIYHEEQWYYLLAENLAKGRGFPSVYYGHYTIWRVVYSILIAPAFLTTNRNLQFFLIGLINSAILSSGVFPSYCIAKEYLSDKRHIYLIVLLYLLMPDMTYSITFACDQPFLVICLWTIYFSCRLVANQYDRRKTRIRDIVLLIFLFVIGLFTKKAMIIVGIAFLVLEILSFFIKLRKNRLRTNVIIFAGLAVFIMLGIWLMTSFGFLQYISQYVDSSIINLGNDISYFLSLFLFMILSDVVALLFFPFILPYVSISVVKRKQRILLSLMSILTVTFAFLSVSVAFDRVTPYEVFLRYVPFLWIPYMVLFLSSLESISIGEMQRKRRFVLGLGLLAVVIGVLYRGMGFWSNVDQTMLFWTLHWAERRVICACCFIIVCLVMCFILYKDQVLFFRVFLGLWIAVQLYNNVVAYQRYRAEWEFSGTDIREIEAFVKEHPEDTFCILDNDFYYDGRYDFSEARVADTFLNYPNVIRSSLSSVLQAENASMSDQKRLELTEYQFPVYCGMSDELYYPPQKVDYLLVPKNATCVVDESEAEICRIGDGDWFEIYKLKDSSMLPEIHAARYYDYFPKEKLTFDVHRGNFVSNYKDDSLKRNNTFISTEEQNYVLFGPYISLPPGEYNVSVNYSYEGDADGRIGYMDLSGSVIDSAEKKAVAYADNDTVSIALDIDEPCDNFEVRLFAEEPGIRVESVEIDLIELTKQEERPGYLIHQSLNIDHTVKQEEYYSREGAPVNNTSGYHTARYSYQNGHRIKSSYFNVNGNPVITTGGYATLKSIYGESGYIVREEYYGADGRPVSIQGYYATEYERDENGDAIEIRYCGKHGERHALPAGYAIIRRTFNKERKIVREAYYDVNDEPVMRTDGYSEVEYRYDENGNLTECKYYDLDGELTLNSSGYAIYRRESNEARQAVRDTYYDSKGERTTRTEGYSTVEYEYDESGNTIEYRFYDLGGNLTCINGGYAILRREFNDQKQLLREEYYDIRDKLVIRPEGYSAVEYSYDEVGNIAEYRYYDQEEELTQISSGYAILRREYNEKRQVIRESYFDENDQPVMCTRGFSAVEYTRDALGHAVEERYYGLNQELTDNSEGYAHIIRTYDRDGEMLEEKAYSADGTRK